MNYRTLASSAALAVTAFAATQALADNMASIAITPATGVVTLTPHWVVGPNLAGFHHMSQDLGLSGSVANSFYSLTSDGIPDGGDALNGFKYYAFGDGASTPHEIGTKLTPDVYLSLTSADPDVGYGSVNFYTIHRKGTTDYFTAIVPGPDTSSAVNDLKPMSGPGGPDTVTGKSGYFALTFAASNLGYGLNQFYYLRNDAETGTVKFGSLEPSLLGTSADQFELEATGYKALLFTGTDVGYGNDKMYYLRHDAVTGNTILGTLDPALAATRHTADIANLGSTFSTLTFIPNDPISLGANQFYLTGSVNVGWQSVSFAAIGDRTTADGSFTVNPTASSGLPITLTVASGSTGSASISAPIGGVFTVTPTAPGLIILQATQAGAAEPVPYNYNMLRQAFTVSGDVLLAITAQPTDQAAITGGTATFSVAAEGTSDVSYQWRKNGVAILANASATTATLTLTNVQADAADTYDVVVTNLSGTVYSEVVSLSVSEVILPVIANSDLNARGVLHTAFDYTIIASGSPTSYNAAPLPAGLSINTATGVISGILSEIGTTSVTLTATNAGGSDTVVLTIKVTAKVRITVGGSLPSPIYIGDGGAPLPEGTRYYAKDLPAGLVLNRTTGEITASTKVRVTSPAGDYTVTYGTVTTHDDGSTTRTEIGTFVIRIDPLPKKISGSFEALVETLPLPGVPVGKVSLLVNADTGAFTGRLINNKSYSFSGVLAFDSEARVGTARVIIPRKTNQNPYRLLIALDATQTADQVFAATLRILNADNTSVVTIAQSSTGVKLARYTQSAPAAWRGAYTMVLTQDANLGEQTPPEGSGFGRATVRRSDGMLVFKGRLGDGRHVTGSFAASTDGSYRWYATPYVNGGSLAGWTQFAPIGEVDGAHQVAGTHGSELYWSRSAHADTNRYSAGFGPVALIATAHGWTAPAADSSLPIALGLNDNTMVSSFTQAGLTDSDVLLLPADLEFNPNRKLHVTVPAENLTGFLLKARATDGDITKANGMFYGSFTLPDSRVVQVRGALLQQPIVNPGTIIGEGFYVVPAESTNDEVTHGKIQLLAP